MPAAEREPQRPLTVSEHLEELRGRLMVCLLALAGGSVIGFTQAERLLEWMRRPASYHLFSLAFFSPTEAFGAYLRLAVSFGFVVALPVILYQVWQFVRPALSWRERYYAMVFVAWGTALFALGGVFAYVGLLPMFLRVLLTIGESQLEPVISVSHYLSFTIGVILACGALFELPLAIVLLARIGVVDPDSLAKQRGLAVLVLVIVAAIVTPTTDAVSLAVMTVPLLALYELSILIARWTVRARR